MTYISLREFIDDILLIVRNNNISESEDLSRHQIAVWIRAYKQMILKDRLDQQKNASPNSDEFEDYIDNIFIRETGPLELEDVKSYDDNPIFTRRTKEKLKNIYDDNEDSILAVQDQNGCIIQYMDHGRRHYHNFRRYTNHELTAYYNDGYIYIEGTQDKNKLKYIWVKAVYEDLPEDSDNEDNIDEDSIAIPAWLVPTIKSNIMKNELSFMLNRPSDDDNNATLQGIKPRGPQDVEK